jgi:hypothetical protein
MTRTGTTTTASPIVTGLKRTDDLFAGLYVYGTGIPVNTTILTVDSATQVTLTNAATATGSPLLEFTPACVGVYGERCAVLQDIWNTVQQYGLHAQVIIRKESNVTRDPYNSIQARADTTLYNFKAWPVEFNPTTKALEKAGIREACECVAWFAMKDFIDNGMGFDDIEIIRTTVKILGNVYEIREKNQQTQVADAYGYLTLGLFKR